MVRTDYTLTLEELASLALSAVSAAVKEGGAMPRDAIYEIGRAKDKKIFSLEETLSLFEEDNTNEALAFACSLSRVIESAREYYFAARRAFGRASVENEEARICVLLAEQICRETELLLHKENKADTEGFCALLKKGKEAHAKSLAGLQSEDNPKHYGHFLIVTARLRRAISHAFDELVRLKEKGALCDF